MIVPPDEPANNILRFTKPPGELAQAEIATMAEQYPAFVVAKLIQFFHVGEGTEILNPNAMAGIMALAASGRGQAVAQVNDYIVTSILVQLAQKIDADWPVEFAAYQEDQAELAAATHDEPGASDLPDKN